MVLPAVLASMTLFALFSMQTKPSATASNLEHGLAGPPRLLGHVPHAA